MEEQIEFKEGKEIDYAEYNNQAYKIGVLKCVTSESGRKELRTETNEILYSVSYPSGKVILPDNNTLSKRSGGGMFTMSNDKLTVYTWVYSRLKRDEMGKENNLVRYKRDIVNQQNSLTEITKQIKEVVEKLKSLKDQ